MTPLLVALLLASNGSGKTLVRTNPGTTVPISGSGVLAFFPFSAPGCYASGAVVGTKGETITVTRAGVATYADASGTIATCAANQARVGCDPTNLANCGLMVEPTRTNYVLNSGTHPKTTQATGTLPTGQARAWHAGTGTMTLANGTATTTGLSCTTVAAGTVCSFNVTGSGTMSITTTAGTTHAQVESGTYRTSQIDTAGSATARNTDAITIVNPLAVTNPPSWCIDGTYAISGRAWVADDASMWGIGTHGAANSARLINQSNAAVRASVLDGSSNDSTATFNSPSAGAHRITVWANSGSAPTLGLDEAQSGPARTLAGAGAIAVMPATITLGNTSTFPFGGYIKSLKISKGACK